MMTYEPGDSFDVFCPNRGSEVEDMLHRMGLYHQRNHRVHISLQKDTKKKGQIHPVITAAFQNVFMPVKFLYYNNSSDKMFFPPWL